MITFQTMSIKVVNSVEVVAVVLGLMDTRVIVAIEEQIIITGVDIHTRALIISQLNFPKDHLQVKVTTPTKDTQKYMQGPLIT